MYPFLRMGKELLRAAMMPKLEIGQTHISYHICWPWDLDFALELNNGRTLSIYDLGRLPMGFRIGLFKMLREKKWGFTMAGCSIRYRRRVRMFHRVKMTTAVLGWDDRFIYIGQSMWRKGECTSSILYRTAVTDQNGIVTTDRVTQTLGPQLANLRLPDWVQNWIDAEATRQWPPDP